MARLDSWQVSFFFSKKKVVCIRGWAVWLPLCVIICDPQKDVAERCRFGLEDTRTYATPMEAGFEINESDFVEEPTEE
jgi:hypothetical protein